MSYSSAPRGLRCHPKTMDKHKLFSAFDAVSHCLVCPHFCKLVRLLLVLAGSAGAILWLSGCQSMPDAIRAVASDTNQVMIRISTPWGTGEYQRNCGGCYLTP